MRKITPVFVLLLATITYWHIYTDVKVPTPLYESPPIAIEDPTKDDILRIKAINEKYSSLEDFTADAKITFTKDKSHRVTAKILCKRPNYRIKINSLLYEEADIGCNDNYFWYWFKRDNEDTLFYNILSKARSTNIPLNPAWLSECFHASPIDLDGRIVKKENYRALVKNMGNLMCVIVFDNDMQYVKGYYIYDENNNLSTYCDIKDTVKVGEYSLPSHIVLSCPRDNIYMEWKITNHLVNKNLQDDLFIMPKKKIMKIIH